MLQKVSIYLLWLFRYDFLNIKRIWFGQEVKVKLGSLFVNLTINDLYNGAKIMILPLAVVEI